MHRAFLSLLALLTMTAGCSRSAAECFAPDTMLPQRDAVLADRSLGQTAGELAAALFDRDFDAAQRLLDRDRALAGAPVGRDADMLILAIGTCDRRFVDLLLAHGAPANGARPGAPLILALRANEPWYAERLLAAGAKPNPAGDPLGPMRTAIALNSPAGVRLLLDHRADPNAMERTGTRALHVALDMERFGIAELLLDRGADPWAIDSGGANLGTSTVEPMLTKTPADVAAQDRLRERVRQLGWPEPAPDPRAIRALAYAGEWPPATARARGAPPVPEDIKALIGRNIVRH